VLSGVQWRRVDIIMANGNSIGGDAASSDLKNTPKTIPVKKPKHSHTKIHLPKITQEAGYTRNPFAAFSYFPDKTDFLNRDAEEEIILLLRKHPFTNVKWILIALFMLIAPMFLTVFPYFDLLPVRFQIASILIWYLVTLAFVIEEFLSWFFHVNIITDERIIEVDFLNLLYRELTDANIDQIQDVTVKIGGALRTTFNYGDIQIQTAAEIPQIVFEAAPRPDAVAKILRELRVEEEIEKLEGRHR
jgi:membrane protein YdbS with pleckstrin-like domain